MPSPKSARAWVEHPRVRALEQRLTEAFEVELYPGETVARKLAKVREMATPTEAATAWGHDNSPQSEPARALAAEALAARRRFALLATGWATLPAEVLANVELRARRLAEETCPTMNSWRESAVRTEAARRRGEILESEHPEIAKRALAGEFESSPASDPNKVAAWIACALYPEQLHKLPVTPWEPLPAATELHVATKKFREWAAK